jgi:sn-glycerol 3-phosphate transport system substrate-binding protein
MVRRSVVACAVVLALGATACGGDDSDDAAVGGDGATGGDGDRPSCPLEALDEADGPVEITYWHGMQEASEATLEQLAEEFNQSQDRVQVRLVNNAGQTHEKYIAGLQTGDLPDVVQDDATYLTEMMDSQSVLPVQSCIDADDYDMSDFLARTVSYFQVDGVQWAMPFGIANPVLIYNRAAFQQAGLDPDAPPETLEDYREAAQALTDAGYRYGIAMAVEAWHFEEFVALQGETYLDNGNGRDARATEVTFDNEVGEELFEFFDGLVDDGLAVTNPREGPSALDNLFAVGNGEAAMTVSSSSNLGSIVQVLGSGQYADVELGIGALPGRTEDGGMVVGGGGLFVSAREPEKQAAAWELVKFLSTPESQSVWAAGTGYVPTRQSAIELSEVDARWAEMPGFGIAYDQLVEGAENAATAGAAVGDMKAVRLAVEEAMTSMFLGNLSPTEALAQAAQEADAAIASYNDRVG